MGGNVARLGVDSEPIEGTTVTERRQRLDEEPGYVGNDWPGDPPVEPDPDPAEADAEAALADVMAALGGVDNARITIYRKKEGKKRAWLDAFEAGDADMEALFKTLRFQYGGGEFYVQVRQSGRLVKNKLIEIEPPPPGPEDKSDQFIQYLRERDRTERQGGTDPSSMLIAMMERQEQQSREQMNMFAQMMQGMFQAITQRPEPQQQPSMRDMVETLVALKGLDGGAENKDSGIEYLLRGIELAKDLNSGESNSFDLMRDAIRNFGGILGQAAQYQGPQGASNVQTQPNRRLSAPNQPAPDSSAPAASRPQQSDESVTARPEASQSSASDSAGVGQTDDATHSEPAQPSHDDQVSFFQTIQSEIAQLCSIADNGGNPEVYAEVVIDRVGPDTAYAVFCESESWEQIKQAFPMVTEGNRAAWFDQLAEQIDYLTGPDDDPPGGGDAASEADARRTETTEPGAHDDDAHGNPERASGDSPDVAGHGGARAAGAGGYRGP